MLIAHYLAPIWQWQEGALHMLHPSLTGTTQEYMCRRGGVYAIPYILPYWKWSTDMELCHVC